MAAGSRLSDFILFSGDLTSWLDLCWDEEIILGRGPLLGISDKRVSRKHALLQVEQAAKRVLLTPHGVNPMFLLRLDQRVAEPMERGRKYTLNVGDTFFLISLQYPWTLRQRKPKEDPPVISKAPVEKPASMPTKSHPPPLFYAGMAAESRAATSAEKKHSSSTSLVSSRTAAPSSTTLGKRKLDAAAKPTSHADPAMLPANTDDEDIINSYDIAETEPPRKKPKPLSPPAAATAVDNYVSGTIDMEEADALVGKSSAARTPPASGSFRFSEVSANLFSAPSDVSLAHCVSRDLNMSKGIAAQFDARFGGESELRAQGPRTGKALVLTRGSRHVFYLVTKDAFHLKPSYETFDMALASLRQACDRLGVRKLAMPRIGCGIDGLDWGMVRKKIIDTFRDSNIHVTIYHFDPPKK